MVDPRLSLSDPCRSFLQGLLRGDLQKITARAHAVCEQYEAARREREEIDQILELTPQDTEINEILGKVKSATRRLTSLSEEFDRLESAIKDVRGELERCKARHQTAQKEQMDEDFKREDYQRMTTLVSRTRVIMQEFLSKATERKIERLSASITESFRFLLRKKTLVKRIYIDPLSFAIILYDETGHALPKQRLSEGEKQIFAISVLWGLARSTARPLPAIIDTPMARLDSSHRKGLVEQYFPNASHQVIILSTDTEVDHHYYEALKPHIARAYHLNYSEKAKATTGEQGYFWEAAS